MPSEVPATENPFLVHDIIGVIYGFFSVAEVLELRLTSRRFNEVAVQTQEDLVDENHRTETLKILRNINIRSSAWTQQLPRPGILAFLIQNPVFPSYFSFYHARNSPTRSSDVRHLLVMIDTLQTPERRKKYFALIEKNELTARDFCNQPIAMLDPLLAIQTLDKLYARILSRLPYVIQINNPIIKQEKKELSTLFRTYYQTHSDETAQAIQEKVNHLFLISKYKEAKSQNYLSTLCLFRAKIWLLALGATLAQGFFGYYFLLPFLYSFPDPVLPILAVLALGITDFTVIVISNKFVMKYGRDLQKTTPFYKTTANKMKKIEEEAGPYLKELDALVSETGMFKTKEVLEEDKLRKALSQEIKKTRLL